MPVLGRVTHFVPDQELKIERRLDLDEDLYLADHLFVHAPCKPVQDCLPVLPLTMSMEFVAEAAALLSPGLGLIGFENVRGSHWIGLRDRSSEAIVIESRVESFDPETGVQRVHGTIVFDGKPSFSATILFSESYRQDIQLELADTSRDGPWPFSVEEVYGDHRMFHGPAFHSVAALRTLGNPGASGTLKAMPRDRLFASRPEPLLLTDPCLMDSVGQFVGLLAQAFQQYILPIGVEKIEFYGPPPAPGVIVPIRAEVVACEPDARRFRFNLELEDGGGHVWARLIGWSDWILKWQDRYFDACRNAYRYLLSEEIALPDWPAGSVCRFVPRDYFIGVDLDWFARLYLHMVEMPAYWQQSKNLRRQTVLSHAAVKDAVRVWWARKYGEPLRHPAEFAIGHDSSGRLYVEPGADSAVPYIGIAHTEGGVLAVASDSPIDMDLETPGGDRIVGTPVVMKNGMPAEGSLGLPCATGIE
jgi:hypothetical protein